MDYKDHQPTKTVVTTKKTKNTKTELGAPSPLTTGQAIDQLISIVNRMEEDQRQPVLEAMVLLNAPQGCSVKFEYCYRCDD